MWVIAAIRRAMQQVAAGCSYALKPEATVDGRFTVGVDLGQMGGITVSVAAVRVVRQGTGSGLTAVVARLEAMLGIMARAIPHPKSAPAKKVVFLVERGEDVAASDRLMRASSLGFPVIRSAYAILGNPTQAEKLATALRTGLADSCIYVAATEAGPDPGLIKVWDSIAEVNGRKMRVAAFDRTGSLRLISCKGVGDPEGIYPEGGPDPGEEVPDPSDLDHGPS